MVHCLGEAKPQADPVPPCILYRELGHGVPSHPKFARLSPFVWIDPKKKTSTTYRFSCSFYTLSCSPTGTFTEHANSSNYSPSSILFKRRKNHDRPLTCADQLLTLFRPKNFHLQPYPLPWSFNSTAKWCVIQPTEPHQNLFAILADPLPFSPTSRIHLNPRLRATFIEEQVLSRHSGS